MKKVNLVSNYINKTPNRCCPICGNNNLSYQIVKELIPTKLTVFEVIILLMVPFIGWIILATNSSHGKIGNATYALCNQCGKSWIIAKDEYKASVFMRIIFPIILIFIIIFLILLLVVVPILLKV